jgi:hypothetical protein
VESVFALAVVVVVVDQTLRLHDLAIDDPVRIVRAVGRGIERGIWPAVR